MIDVKLEIVISIILIIVLIVFGTPLTVNLFTNVLPTNKYIEIEEIIGNMVSEDSETEFIQSSDYLYIVETTNENITKEHFAYKGKTSGYIPTAFTYGTGDRIKRYKNSVYVGDIQLKYYISMHNEKYVIKMISYGGIIELFDSYGCQVNNIGPRYFYVLEENDKNWELIGRQNDIEVKIIDNSILIECLGGE